MTKRRKQAKQQQRSAPSKLKLAADLGISRTTLYEWQGDGCPVDDGAEAVLSWAMERNKKGHESTEIKAAKLRVLVATAERIELANKQKMGQLVEKSEVQQPLARGMGMIAHELDRFASVEGPPALKGLSERDIEFVLKAAITRINANFRSGFETLLKDPEGPSLPNRASSSDEHVSMRKLFDMRVDAERRWRAATETDKAESSRIWHNELVPLLAGRMPEPQPAERSANLQIVP